MHNVTLDTMVDKVDSEIDVVGCMDARVILEIAGVPELLAALEQVAKVGIDLKIRRTPAARAIRLARAALMGD